MTVHTDRITVSSKGNSDIIDITSALADCIGKSGISNGIASVFCPGSTCGLTTTEFEPGAIRDIKEFLNLNIPPTPPGPPWGEYFHHQTWHDDNGHAHLRASVIGSDITVPVRDGRPVHGTWQQVIFIDFDTRPRSRILEVTVMGE